jgi:5-(carboxyamino)imidazole ribonucleotide synthase
VDSAASLSEAIGESGTPCVLKTADFGYDGKGQVKLTGAEDLEEIWKTFSAPRGVLEKWIPFQAELSVICARGLDGKIVSFPVSENQHVHHILDLSIVPGRFPVQVLEAATALGEQITAALDVVGLLAVEMFLTADGNLLVNELAPRPHNSGHYTIEACATSQFEQHLRAVSGLPLGATTLLHPATSFNLLGAPEAHGEPAYHGLDTAIATQGVAVHLYGKHRVSPYRKMGHVTVTASDRAAALQKANELQQLIRIEGSEQ